MKISTSLLGKWRRWPFAWPGTRPADAPPPDADSHLRLARESLRELLADPRVPPQVRDALADDYAQVQAMLDKLDQGHIHIAVFGRVSVGKSATLNALLGGQQFSTSPLHGETRRTQMGQWTEYQSGGVFLIDTPGINEVAGADRERLAREVATRADLVLFIVDGDLTDSELRALRALRGLRRPVLLVFNKVDRYTQRDREALLESLRAHSAGWIEPRDIVCISARPAERLLVRVDEGGREREEWQQPPPDVSALRERLWQLLEAEGKTLAALNASLFAGSLSDDVGQRVLEVRRLLGEQLIRTYCIAKGVAVALTPVPLADLAAALMVDLSLVLHLSNLYGLPLSRTEAGGLVRTLFTQMALLMGATWFIYLLSSLLRLGTGGLSTVVTGGAQGAVAYYTTYVVGEAAERYLAGGKSWGPGGPKQVVREILAGLDRESILAQARAEIARRLRSA